MQKRSPVSVRLLGHFGRLAFNLSLRWSGLIVA